jgi:hypothetical protein
MSEGATISAPARAWLSAVLASSSSHFFLHCLQGSLHDAVLGVGARGGLVLRLRNTEENDGGNTQAVNLPALFNQLVDREVEDAGHGGDFLAHAFARHHEQRVDQALHAQAGLAHEPPQRFRLPQPPQPCLGEGHRHLLSFQQVPRL